MPTLISDEMLARVASSKHGQIALEEGAKAGFKAYMKAPGRDRTFDNLNAKRGFDRYCGEFGPYLEVLGLSAVGAAPVVEGQTDDAIQAMIEAAVASALAAAGVASPKVRTTRTSSKTRKSTPKAKAVSLGRESKFSAKVIAALNIPCKVGGTFTWKGKHGTSKWTVVSGSASKGIVARKVA